MAKSLKESLQDIQNTSAHPLSIEDTPMLMMLNPNTEPEITVDMDSRVITVPKELQNIGVVNDNNAETVYIRIPSTTFDDISLTDKTAYIEYINAGNEYDTYEIKDIVAENGTLKLGWTISNDVTRYAGIVSFLLTFELSTSYKWSTVPATFNIRAGLNVDSTVSPSETAVVSALFSRVSNLESSLYSLSSQIGTRDDDIYELHNKVSKIENDLEQLKDDVVYVVHDTGE